MHGVRLVAKHDRVIEDAARHGWAAFEPESMAAWLAVARPGVTMLDIGAYTGLYAIAAALRGAEVHALEPNPEAYARLLDNVRANGVGVVMYRCAAGCTTGRGRLAASRVPLTSGARVVPDAAGDLDVLTVDGLDIHAPVVALKVDVEGLEVDVLAGAMDTLRRDRPLVIAEAHTEQDCAAIGDVLAPLGYRCRRADGRNLICEAP